MFQGYRKAIVLSTRNSFCRLALKLCPCGSSKRIRVIDQMAESLNPNELEAR